MKDNPITAKIIGTGSFLPEKVFTNSDFEKIVETSDQWITERTGIKSRHFAEKNMASSDLATHAAKKALKAAGVEAKDLDLILVATITPDMFFPPTACFVQANIGAKNAAAFDIVAVCSGFVYALSVAESFIKSGKYKKVLVIGVEVMSKIINFEDRNTCVIFGDGSGAVVLVPSKNNDGVLSTHLYSDGNYAEMIQMPGGGSRNPISKEIIEKKLHYVHMNGRETYKIAVKMLTKACLDAIKHNKLTPEDIDVFIPHQANLRIIDAVASRLKFPKEKIVVTINQHGNTSAASIPLALDYAVKEGRIHDGDYILMVTFGGGLTWASALIKW